MTGTIVAVITGLAFVGMAVYLVVGSRRIQYPDGISTEISVGGLSVRLIHDMTTDHVLRSELVETTQVALRAALNEWPVGAFAKPLTGELVIHVTRDTWHGLHGYQMYAKARIGSRRVPMLVISDSDDMRRTASLIIHEMGHLLSIALLGSPDVQHADPRVWANEEMTSFEARAMRLYDGK
jgi:hypothetical protein